MPGLSVYKPGQGYWTRVISAVSAGTIVLAGIAWLMATMETWDIWRIEQPAAVSISVDPATIGQDPASAVAAFGIQNPGIYAPGVQTADLEPQALAAASRGVTIGQIRPGSPAASAGLIRGQVVSAVGGKPVATEEQLATALVEAASGSGEPVALAVNLIRFNDILIYAQAISAVVILAITGGVLWYLLNKPRIADFLIATEIEMRKVSWPSRREIIGSTWIVICGTLMMVALLFIVNLGFTWFFQEIGILAGG